jgi:hypothetical protein
MKIKKYLRPNGQIIASIPNVAHFLLIEALLKGNWDYADRGEVILNKNHLRFFTLKSIKDMFEMSGYLINQIKTHNLSIASKKNFLEYLDQAVPLENKNELLVDKYLVKAQCRF